MNHQLYLGYYLKVLCCVLLVIDELTWVLSNFCV